MYSIKKKKNLASNNVETWNLRSYEKDNEKTDLFKLNLENKINLCKCVIV